MQGRLVDSEKKNSIQYFPAKKWQQELILAKKLNFKIMEWTINIENMEMNPIFNGDIDRVKFLKKKNKIDIPSLTCDYFMQAPFFKKKNQKKKKTILDNLKKIIENGQKIGIKYFIFPLVDNSSIKLKSEEVLLIDGIKNDLLIMLNKKSKILFEIDYSPKNTLKFIKKFKSKKVGINYDTGNSSGLNYDFYDEIKYFKYVHNIHIKDRKLYGSTVRLGNGNWDYKKFFGIIKKKYKGNFILQTARNSKNKHLFEINKNRKFFYKYYA